MIKAGDTGGFPSPVGGGGSPFVTPPLTSSPSGGGFNTPTSSAGGGGGHSYSHGYGDMDIPSSESMAGGLGSLAGKGDFDRRKKKK